MTWRSLGFGSRSAGGWERGSLGLPVTGTIRARGRTSNGHSSGMVETVAAYSLGPAAPEIVVNQPLGTDVSDGGSKNFGEVLAGSNSSLAFTIHNIGNALLSGVSITMEGANAESFTVTANPAVTVSGNATTSFTVRFAPANAGAKTATLHIASNDADENPFDILLTGTGIEPEIAVEQPLNVNIRDGGSKDFGNVRTGDHASLTFTIRNVCCSNLTDLNITMDGTDAAMFNLTASPAASVSGPDGSTTFSVEFAPASIGMKSAALHIASNDTDENPFDITLSGGGTDVPSDISVEQPPGTDLPDGGSREFNEVILGRSAKLSFTVTNKGIADLAGLAITKTGADAAMFIVPNSLAPISSPGGHISFAVEFIPGSAGIRSAALHIASNDPDENPFDIALTGVGVARPGILDTAFEPGVSGAIDAIAVQPDGGILLGGYFTSINGEPRQNIARLLPDGSVESMTTFSLGSGVNGTVYSMIVQADGKVLLGGTFNYVNNQGVTRIARLFADGNVEKSPGMDGSADGTVFCAAMQADGKFLIGGCFYAVRGQPHRCVARLLSNGVAESGFNAGPSPSGCIYSVATQADGKVVFGGSYEYRRIGRFNADGSVDSTFSTGLGVSGDTITDGVHSIVVQPDGKILIAGGFNSVNGSARNRIARLHPGGSVESTTTFNPGAGLDGTVYGLALQADGRILLSGAFTSVNGEPRNRIARLNADGTLDNTFLPGNGANAAVYGLALQADGKILFGGDFSSYNGTARNRIARLLNDATIDRLTAPDNTRLLWTRRGAAPEVEQVSFDFSSNNGASWTPLGPGTRIPGGWERTGLNLPATSSIRARGRATSGLYNGSSGIVEQTLNVSEIALFESSGLELFDGITSTDFGPTAAGTGGSKEFTIRNKGTGDLTGLAVTLAAGGNAGDFTIAPPGGTLLAPGAATTFTVSFSPAAAGTRTAALRIASNDVDENPFDLNLTGIRATASEAWRQTYFGSPYNTGAGADLNDADHDGIVNILEYATATDPLVSSAFPGTLVKNGNLLEFTYTRRKSAVVEMSFVREFSETLNGTWGTVGGLVETILSDDGVLQQVKTTVPAGSIGKRFVRLRVTRL